MDKEKLIISVKDKREGRMYAVPDPIDEDQLSDDERETLQHMSGLDPHFWGPGYGED
jgi:hypothetical protein